VTLKITEGGIVLMADNNEMQELREQLFSGAAGNEGNAGLADLVC
jgi:hypothetical protein